MSASSASSKPDSAKAASLKKSHDSQSEWALVRRGGVCICITHSVICAAMLSALCSIRYKGIAGISFSISADLKKKAFSISVDSYFKAGWILGLVMSVDPLADLDLLLGCEP
ncbi:uncharacterized protein LOC127265225 [Andrographis paniculata]|uniref:uncharacterized protein LOC127265225 n=1 Tax=Andrographis paniculata TaxID=175694 RepID=UPI0021E96540|nr:uncharacterized protein LOC127265225 [Andrographis paniculata]